MLIYRGFDVNTLDQRGRTAISHAAERGHMGATTVLVKHGADINMIEGRGRTPLSYAAANGYTEVVQELLTAGAQVECQRERKHYDSPLLLATAGGYHDVAMKLLEHGAVVYHKGRQRRTPLSHAAEKSDNGKLVRLLLPRRADACIRGIRNRTPLH
ncbi:ankyrin repeat-containing domain protein [Aspergillus carlsbadensis]|nr:ankyrin repeat-containing domain protein [Aspergillus carlsbadensis]